MCETELLARDQQPSQYLISTRRVYVFDLSNVYRHWAKSFFILFFLSNSWQGSCIVLSFVCRHHRFVGRWLYHLAFRQSLHIQMSYTTIHMRRKCRMVFVSPTQYIFFEWWPFLLFSLLSCVCVCVCVYTHILCLCVCWKGEGKTGQRMTESTVLACAANVCRTVDSRVSSHVGARAPIYYVASTLTPMANSQSATTPFIMIFLEKKEEKSIDFYSKKWSSSAHRKNKNPNGRWICTFCFSIKNVEIS